LEVDVSEFDTYEASIEFRFEATDGERTKVINYAVSDEVPPFETLMHDFLNWATSVYEWDRKDVRFKALEALGNWEA
jgi:hypothetical protein